MQASTLANEITFTIFNAKICFYLGDVHPDILLWDAGVSRGVLSPKSGAYPTPTWFIKGSCTASRRGRSETFMVPSVLIVSGSDNTHFI